MNKLKYIHLLKRILYYLYGEKFFKRLNYDWRNLPDRTLILKEIIKYKNYNSYLEIGCDQDENFSQISIK
ncbi:MAG: class I SAM-dependent methyltransferase, partial [Pelagibacteraceae bacterium]